MIRFFLICIFIILISIIYKFYNIYVLSKNENFINNNNVSVPIDIVYTWVDGNDMNWLNNKNKYLKYVSNYDGNINNRFNDNNELKYSLRSIYKYANWINNIYIVVADGQKPKWLNTNHNKIHLINHSEIIDKEYLPTFNSHVIEHNLYKIPNLSENFLYFNDDFFLGNYIKKKDIMYNDNIGYYLTKKKYGNKNSSCKYISEVTNNEIGFVSAWKNNNKLIKLLDEKLYNINCPWHQGVLCKKSIFVEINYKYKNIINKVLNNKFRSIDDIAPIGLSLFYGLYKKKYIINTKISNRYVPLNKSKNFIYYLNSILYNRPKFFCINDIGTNDTNIKYMNDFFELYFKDKCPYEK